MPGGSTSCFGGGPEELHSLRLEIIVDWERVDKIDAIIDGIGIIGDLAVFVPPLAGPAQIFATGVEFVGFCKSGFELISGDPSSMLVTQTTNQAKIVVMASRFGRMTPYVGVAGNLLSLYLNLQPEVTWRID
jgi:hypothetical protein